MKSIVNVHTALKAVVGNDSQEQFLKVHQKYSVARKMQQTIIKAI